MAGLTQPLTPSLPWLVIRAVCRLAVRRVDVRVEGLQHLPATGPAIIAARHFHHFYDGCALLAVVPRPLHPIVALDWLEYPAGRWVMERACRSARWPVVPRPDDVAGNSGGTADVARLRAATRESVRLLRVGQMLLVFPEGYPNVDPGYTPKSDDDAFLPFRLGFLRFVAIAERDGMTQVPIVPAGLEYRRGDRWRLTVRFGSPTALDPKRDHAEQVLAIEEQVRRLSGHAGTRRGEGQRDRVDQCGATSASP
jgi:1-acyl-sn-glycerol-3-phosphate acyltransferase